MFKAFSILWIMMVSGCVWVPPAWDAGNAINSVNEIRVGSTTKAEVLKKLGEPEHVRSSESGSLLHYSGKRSGGFVVSLWPTNYPNAGMVGEENWWVEIMLDRLDVVSNVLTTDTANWYREGFHNPNPEAIKRLCSAAKFRSPMALLYLGLFKEFADPPHQDLARAYMYYSLAQRSGVPEAGGQLLQLMEDARMSESLADEGIKLVSNWSPAKPCP